MGFTQDIIKKISPFMKQSGYIRKGKCFYYVQNDIAFCVELDYTGHLLYVTYYFMPLYIPALNRYYSYGNRLNSHPQSKLSNLDANATKEQISFWLEELIYEIKHLVNPFFADVSNPSKVIQYLHSDNINTQHIHCPEIQINRLLLFTHSYLHNKEDIIYQANKMHRCIQSCTFLSPKILDKYLDETRQMVALNNCLDKEIDEHFVNTISRTKEACF